MEEIHDAYVFDKIDWKNQYLYYAVYIPKLKIVSRLIIKSDLKDYTCVKIKLYLMEDGITLKRKIRVEIQN